MSSMTVSMYVKYTVCTVGCCNVFAVVSTLLPEGIAWRSTVSPLHGLRQRQTRKLYIDDLAAAPDHCLCYGPEGTSMSYIVDWLPSLLAAVCIDRALEQTPVGFISSLSQLQASLSVKLCRLSCANALARWLPVLPTSVQLPLTTFIT